MSKVLVSMGLVVLLSCTFIVDSCGCSIIPPAEITPGRLDLAIGDSARVVSESVLELSWTSRDSTVAVVSPTMGYEAWVHGRDVGNTMVIGTYLARGADTVIVIVRRSRGLPGFRRPVAQPIGGPPLTLPAPRGYLPAMLNTGISP